MQEIQATLIEDAKKNRGWFVSGFHWIFSACGRFERNVRTWSQREDFRPVYEDCGAWQPRTL